MLNHEALATPQLADLYERAFRRMVPQVDPEAALEECWAHIRAQDKDFAVLVATRGTDLVGLSVISSHTGAFNPAPFILAFYAEAGVKRTLAEATFAWGVSRGYDRAWVMNGSGLPDETWVELFKAAVPGRPIRQLTTVWEFTKE